MTVGDDETIDLEGMDLNDGVEILSQDVRIKKFGVGAYGPSPTGDGIFFKAGTWKPGGEYIQKLIVRNVSTTVKKLKYKLPSTRFFSLAYPEVIILSPGMSQELDVIFRPVSLDPYDDTVFIRVLNGSGGFHVSVRATIDKLIVTSPFGVDLGFCPTYQTTSSTFVLSNDGEVDAPFRWETPKGFVLEPLEGIIPIGRKVDVTVSVVPTEANVMVGQAVCRVGEGVHAIIPDPVITTRLSAIGKYAYISLSDPSLKWGEVLTGTSSFNTKKELVLRNTSVVPAEFRLIRHETDSDEVFDVQPREGVVPPQSEIIVTAMYSPLGVGVYSLDRYTFVTPGDCRTKLDLSGTSMPAKVEVFKEASLSGGGTTLNADGTVSFSEASPGNSLNFRDVELGHSETRILMLKNNSNKDIHFSVVADIDGTFKMKPRQGVIKASGPPFALVMSFSPHKPINYYRRIWVTCSDRMPLFYDAMGSGYVRAKGEIKEQRPAPLRHAHVQAYRNRAVAGIGALSPDELDRLYNEGTADPAYFALVGKSGTRALSTTALANPLSRTGDVTRTEVSSAHEMFIATSDLSCRDVTVDKSALDFGYSLVHKTSETKTVSVSNNSNGKVAVTWHIPRAVTEDGQFQEPVFSISPDSADINAGQTSTFKVTFRPFQADRNFVSELEVFVYFKNQRTFRLVNDSTLTPPWCLPVAAMGHSFSTGQLLASTVFTGANVRGGKLVFPTCFEGETLYQPLIVKNPTNLPCAFKFEFGFGEDRLGGMQSDDVFSIWPPRGEINAESFVVVYVRFVPIHARKYLQLLKCIVNGSPGAKLLLEGNCTVPFLLCPDITPAEPIGRPTTPMAAPGGMVLGIPGVSAPPNRIENGPIGSFYLKPTCVGLSTSRTFSLKNGSRIPLRFRLSLPPEAEGIVTVTPDSGLLRGNEIATMTIAFAPREAEKYTFKLKAKAFPIGGRADRVIDARQPMGTGPPECLQSINVFLVAPGELGAVQFDPPRVSMDVRLVNTSETKDVYLENVSDCDLKYKLVYREEFLRDTGFALTAEKAKEDTVVSVMKPLQSISARDTAVKAKEQGRGKNGDDDIISESLLCHAPEGILRARSRFRCPVTFQPAKAGLFDFFLYCQVEIIDPHSQDRTMMLPNEEVALLRVNQSDRETYMQGEGISALSGIPLSVCVTSRATFPKITIEDVRLEQDSLVGDVSHLWRNMSLSRLNTDLSKPLTESEFKLNLSSSPDLSQLKRYRFEFSPNVVGSPLQEVTFKFKNNGHLTTRFHLHLPNEKELELEQWCDEDEPSEELYKIICMIEELKLFTIEPSHGILEPGESCDLTISYSHAYLKYGGVHNLPVHVKLDKGKQFFLDLCGRTLPSPVNLGAKPPKFNSRPGTVPKPMPLTNINAPPPARILLSACVGESGNYSLMDVPIGLASNEAPLQRLELINPSAFKCSYEVDMAPIDALIEKNHGSPVLRVANPAGTVDGGQSVFLDWYFYPLEVKEYDIPIRIRYEEVESIVDSMPPMPPGSAGRSTSNNSNGSNTPNTKAKALASLSAEEHKQITFNVAASGYDPREKDLLGNFIDNRDRNKPHVFGLVPPEEQLIVFDKQLASISHDVFDLHMVPQNSKCNRLLIIRNLNNRDSIDFKIEVNDCELVKDGQLKIYPTSGKLDPLEHAVVDFSFVFDTKAIAVMDRVRIITREIVKVAPKRRAGHMSKEIARVITKTETKEHESVIKRVTKSHSSRLEHFEVPEGKNSSMPSTINAKGDVVQGVKYGIDPMAPDAGVGGGGTVVGGVGFENSTFGASITSMPAPGEGIIGVGEEGLSRSMTGPPPSGKGDKSPTGSRSSRGMLGSTSMRRSKSEEPKSDLKGRSNCFILRLRGMVLPYQTLCALFKDRHRLGDSTGPQKDGSFIEDFFVPPSAKFIAPISTSTFIAGSESTEIPPKVRIADVFGSLGPAHQFEVRSVSEMVITDLFRTLLNSEQVAKYTEEVLEEASSRDLELAKKKRGASGTLEVDGPLDEELRISGNPVYGMYFEELLKIDAAAAPAAAEVGARRQESDDLAEEDIDGFDSEIPFPMHTTSGMGPGNGVTEKVDTAMRSNDFIDLTAEILRNTMFNLMQEVTYEEFPVEAEPLAFYHKD